MTQKKPPVFLRDATGLVREIGPVSALILAIAAIVGPTWIPVFSSEWFLFPGVSVPLSFVLIGILGLVHGAYYVLIAAAMPRSGGGGYIPISRVIHPALGMGMGFILIAAFMFNIGFVANLMVVVGVAGPLGTYATLTNNVGLQSLAALLSTPTWAFIIGTLIILVTGLIAVAGTPTILKVNRAAFIVGTAGFLIIIGLLVATTQEQFRLAFNSFSGSPDAYQSVIDKARSAGMGGLPSDWITPTLLSLPLSFFSIVGYAFGTYYAGEVKRVSRTLTFAVVGSLIYTAGIFSIVALLTERAFGTDFIYGVTYLFNAAPANYPLSAPPWVSTFLVILNSNPILNAIVIASYVAWGYFLIINYFIIPSRHFFAWAFDRSFPSALANVNERFHSPVLAIVVIGILGWITLVFYVFLPTILGPVNQAFLFIAAWLVDGLAGVLLPWRRKGLFQAAPEIVRKKVAGIPLVSLLGAYSVIFMGGLFVATLVTPSIIGPLAPSTIGTVVVAFVLGVAVYVIAKGYYGGRGIDITLAFKEIPPE
jgi:APA family basic amino acid/polyamine antiporter